MALEEKSDDHKSHKRLHPLGIMNVCAESHANLLKLLRYFSLDLSASMAKS